MSVYNSASMTPGGLVGILVTVVVAAGGNCSGSIERKHHGHRALRECAL
jgi:hypothetical protein